MRVAAEVRRSGGDHRPGTGLRLDAAHPVAVGVLDACEIGYAIEDGIAQRVPLGDALDVGARERRHVVPEATPACRAPRVRNLYLAGLGPSVPTYLANPAPTRPVIRNLHPDETVRDRASE